MEVEQVALLREFLVHATHRVVAILIVQLLHSQISTIYVILPIIVKAQMALYMEEQQTLQRDFQKMYVPIRQVAVPMEVIAHYYILNVR